jgi:hypothetical protein
VNAITKNCRHGRHRIHLAQGLADEPSALRPLCGGGNSARGAQWQEVLIEVDCRRCRQILERRQQAQQAKAEL